MDKNEDRIHQWDVEEEDQADEELTQEQYREMYGKLSVASWLLQDIMAKLKKMEDTLRQDEIKRECNYATFELVNGFPPAPRV